MIRKALLVVMVATIQTGLALMQAYSVEPVKAAWSGWTDTIPGYDYISQTITCNFDSLKYVELFAGDTCSGEAYNLSVLTLPGGYQVASGAGNAMRSHSWVRFDDLTITAPESIVKGKTYEFKFTRSGSDSIQYYWDSGEAYPYGQIVNPSGLGSYDLALRAFGVMDTIGADWFGVNPYFPWKGANQQGGQWWGPGRERTGGRTRFDFA